MILLDANLFMYAAGTPHPLKVPSAAWLERVAAGEIDAAMDAEVLQEILHRYRSIRRWEDGRRVFDLARRIVPSVLPVTVEVLEDARRLLDRHPMIMARDALHAAVVRLHRAEGFCSWDRDFDGIEGVRRIEPDRS